jgi:hypothetical protein
VPWKWRALGEVRGERLIVELLEGGRILVSPEDRREQLRPSEVQWIEEEALPQLFIEWCEDPLRWAG